MKKELGREVKMHRLKKGSPLIMVLQDARTMVKLVAIEPTRLSQAIPQRPDIIVHASKEGVGRIVHSALGEFKLLAFIIGFPEDIKKR